MSLQHVSVCFPPGEHDAVRAFYGGTLGLREIEVPPGLEPGRFVWFDGGGERLEVHLMPGEVAAGDHHFCIEVDDLEALRSRLEAEGRWTRDGSAIAGRARLFTRDPFGNLIELCRFDA